MPNDVGGREIALSPEREHFELLQRQAGAFAGSMLVPETLRGSRENCIAAMMIADEMGESRIAVMQNIFFIKGRAGWQASYMVSRANRSGKFKGPLRWRSAGSGDTLAVTCYADLAGIEDPRVEITVDFATAVADGWTRNEKYKSIPEQMLRWRSASWLIRLYCPEVMMGLPTSDELEDIAAPGAMKDVTPEPPPRLADFAPSGARETPTRAEGDPPAHEPVERQKRHRRTKAEMEAARVAEQQSHGYEIIDCDGETWTAPTASAVESKLMEIFAEAQKRGVAAIAAAIEDNRATVESLLEGEPKHRLTYEMAQLSGMLKRTAEQNTEISAGEGSSSGRAPREDGTGPRADTPDKAPGKLPTSREIDVPTRANGSKDYRAFTILLLAALRKEPDLAEKAFLLGDNDAHIAAAKHAQPEYAIAFQAQIDDLMAQS